MSSSAATGEASFREGTPAQEVDVLRRALDALRAYLPTTWTLDSSLSTTRSGVAFDALVKLVAPDRSSATLVIGAKHLIATRDVPAMIERLREKILKADVPSAVPMVVARYVPRVTQERLERDGVAYADATGNLRVVIDRPALVLRSVGADRDPWRGPGRPRGSLRGAPAARVVRALVDFSPPYTVKQLTERSGASTGATYRVVDFLEQEELLERRARGPITAVAWRKLIERWSHDYSFDGSDVVQSFLYPRGVEAVPQALRSVGGDGYVLTGSLAVQRYAPYAPPRLAMLYVTDVTTMAEKIRLRPVGRGANMLLASNRDAASFLRSKVIDGVVTAAPSQIAVDLLTAPGRSPSEGQALLDWMESNEPEWRW